MVQKTTDGYFFNVKKEMNTGVMSAINKIPCLNQ